MSKELRILTGFHAGAQIQLNPTTMSIGAEATADILITDWSEGTMQLTTNTQGNVTIGAAHDADLAQTLADFAPRRFGEVVLCAGPREAQWPSDLQLLQAMLNAPAEAEAAAATPDGAAEALLAMPVKRVSWLRTGLTAMALGSLGMGVLALTVGNASHAATRPAAQADLADLRHALESLKESDIELRAQTNGFVARGVVATGERARKVRARLQDLAGKRLHWEVRQADDIARELAESLHEPQVKVSYGGGARFNVVGSSRQPGMVHDVVERFRHDMAPLALDIGVKVEHTDELGVAGKVDSALSTGEVRYIESSDGTKHFVADASGTTIFH